MKCSVMVVDDQETFARQIRKRLERDGYEVEVSHDDPFYSWT